MKRVKAVLVIVLLSGCASSSQTYTSDGRAGYSLNCSGTARNWGMCESKAGEICGARGYEILSRTGDQGFIASGNNGDFYAGTTTKRNMLIACR